MSDENIKEVRFDQYCNSCEHKKIKADDDKENICSDCLAEPGRQYSHKPINYKEKK